MAEQSDGWSDTTPSAPFQKVDFRAAIAATLATLPIDDAALRGLVWIFVGAERKRGTKPDAVIVALSNLLDDAVISPLHMQQALMRRIILWTVEAYFGHLGGEVYAGSDAGALSSEALDPTAAWRRQIEPGPSL